MKKQLLKIILIFLFAITAITLLFSTLSKNRLSEDAFREQLVDLNEIGQLSKMEDGQSSERLENAIDNLKQKLKKEQELNKGSEVTGALWIFYFIFVLFLFTAFGYVYRAILRPFDKLQVFADEIAKGNFDLNLKYERTNYFGKFTWAFDHMRREITKARACEREAIDNNKTVIATLSHDIKTPIASIRAYAEGLDANLASGPEMRRKYSSVIMKKCDEVTKLTDDLFLHSLSSLDKLKMNLGEENLRGLLMKTVSELKLKDDLVSLTGEIPDVKVNIDAKRFEQVIENLINNAKKYAPGSRVEIGAQLFEGSILVSIQDYGGGILDEDLPFLFDKFYRGRNAGEQQGSGLGLYIVKYIMEQLGGSAVLQNTSPGLKVSLIIPAVPAAS